MMTTSQASSPHSVLHPIPLLAHRLHRGVAVADLAIDADRCLDQSFPPRQPPLLGGMPAVMSLSCRFRHLNLLDKAHCQMLNSDNSACQKENIAHPRLARS